MDLLQGFIFFSIKKTSASGIKNENIPNKKLVQELTNQLLKSLIKEKFCR